MRFTYSDEQAMLLDSVLRFGQEHFPPTERHRLIQQGRSGEAASWAKMAELGWLLLPIAEECGGLGGGIAELMALGEGFGRNLVPGPYVAACVLAPALLARGGDGQYDLIEQIGTGETLVAAALLEDDGGYDLHHIATRAAVAGDHWTLDGAKAHVEDGGDADWFIVPARTGGETADRTGISLFLVAATVPGLRVERFRGIDGHRHARLELDGVAGQLIGAEGNALADIEAAVARANCAYLAEAVGSMEAVSAITLEYLRTREQFGRPIGSFQVLQHRMVDMTVACEEARAMLCHIALSLAQGQAQFQRAVSAAKVRIGECGVYVGQQAVQLHGGVGFSDELIVSHHLKRQMMLAIAHGSVDHHRMRFAA
ncbi:acyl-CoA dehydrogenase [Blastomonas sp. AAP53]|uniref:acyl-CoA dehydrogenase family protein n=1 Tax=Blastomonas sp. AAP53 TaxID=1248760 RepID=UPI0002E98D72|nr:acyl-CoA dehydrogenase [Blastomonas sp. AAP53]